MHTSSQKIEAKMGKSILILNYLKNLIVLVMN